MSFLFMCVSITVKSTLWLNYFMSVQKFKNSVATCGSTFLPVLKINLSDKKNKMLPSIMDSWCRDCFFFGLNDGQGLYLSDTTHYSPLFTQRIAIIIRTQNMSMFLIFSARLRIQSSEVRLATSCLTPGPTS